MSALTKAESSRYSECLSVVRATKEQAEQFALACLEIRDSKLYREQYDTWEDFCRSELKKSKTQINRLIASEQLSLSIESLTPTGVKPKNERAARELATIPAKDRAAVIREAAKESETNEVSVAEIKAAAAKVAKPPPPPLVLDDEGNAVTHPKAIEAFQGRDAIEDVAKAAHDLLRTVEELATTPAGSRLNVGTIKAAVNDIKTHLRRQMPHVVCPNYPRNCGPRCRCHDTGWITKLELDNSGVKK